MSSFFLKILGSIVPVDGIIRIRRSVAGNLPADAHMVSANAAPDLPEGKLRNVHMSDDIAFFRGKMMIGHGGLLSGTSVGGASLYQKIPSCPLLY